MNHIILCDTEGTALVESSAAPLETQPHMMEWAGVKVTDDQHMKEVGRLIFKVKPRVPVPDEVVKITGLTTELLAKEKGFAASYESLCQFFLGTTTLMAHNLPYDAAVLAAELGRIDRLTKFPWPPRWVCVVEATQYITGKYLKLTELYQHLFKKDPQQIHRAEDDTELLLACARALRKKGVLLKTNMIANDSKAVATASRRKRRSC